MSRGSMRRYVLRNGTNKNDRCRSPEAEQYEGGHRQTEAGVDMYSTRRHARRLTSTLLKPSETGNGERLAVGLGDDTQS